MFVIKSLTKSLISSQEPFHRELQDVDLPNKTPSYRSVIIIPGSSLCVITCIIGRKWNKNSSKYDKVLQNQIFENGSHFQHLPKQMLRAVIISGICLKNVSKL